MQPLFSNLTHPTRDQLRRFVVNDLSTDDIAMIRNHLRICVDCQNTVQAIQNNDPVIETHDQQLETAGAQTKPLMAIREETASTLPIPESLVQHPRYKVLNLLGTGGMGTVFRAMDRMRGEYVAIKVLQIDDRQSVGRFQREVELLTKLQHRNLVSIYDASLANEQPYIVMECVEGLSLDRLLLRRGMLKIADACEIIRQVAEGLQHAHDQQVVHRDIKPSNIMVTNQGQVKLLDWGLARIWQETSTHPDIFITVANQTLGTPEYIAPEQLQDSHNVDHRADIYSLGGTLFSLLTGMPPRDWRPERSENHGWLKHPDAAIGNVRKDVKAPLRRLVAHMMQMQPQQRLHTATLVEEALRPYCSGARLKDLMLDSETYRPLEKTGKRWERFAVWMVILTLFAAAMWLAW